MRLNREEKKIFVADSSITYRLLVNKVLSEAGYMVYDAADGVEAIQQIKELLPSLDLVVLDLNLPKIKGIDVIRKIRETEEGSTVGIIVVTEFLSDHLKAVLEELGVTIYINKFFALRDLLYQVDAVLFPEQKNVRRSRRKLVNLPVNYWVGSELFLNQCYDLSPDGMFIVMTEEDPPPNKTKLVIRFWLPFSEQLISCEGEVMWRNKYDDEVRLTHPPGIGVQFTDISDEDRRLIQDFLDKA